nr:prominin-1-A-like isoform X3 [Danaus plexippus plexippus]
MSSKTFMFAILLANLVILKTDGNSVSEEKTTQSSLLDSVFALQIRQIQTTSQETPADSAGNNLNTFDGTVLNHFLNVPQENFQSILSNNPIRKTTAEENDDKNQENKETEAHFAKYNSSSSAIGSNDIEAKKALNLIWDNCYETLFRDDSKTKSTGFSDENKRIGLETENMKTAGNVLSKRNSLKENNTSTLRSWLENYNIYKTATNEDLELSSSTELIASTSQASVVPIIPITKNININQYTVSYNNDIGSGVVTESNFQSSFTDDWYNPKESDSKIKFSSLPQMQTYLIPKFKLDEGFYPFHFMSKVFSVIYLFEYPVGVVKDIVRGRFTFPYSFLQAIKVESTFLVIIVLFGCLALVLPLYLFILSLISLFSKSKCTDEIESGTLFLEQERPDCHDRILVTFTFLFLLICCGLISGMVLSNEQSRIAISESRNVFSCACADVAAWLSSAAQELHHSLVPPVDMVYYAYSEDLRDVERLLGEPIQQAIASESGIDLVLDSLADIITESEDLSTKVSALRDICVKAGLLANSASERIMDLIQQLDNLKKHCIEKDAPLCDTLNTNSLHITMKLDSVRIVQEQQLLELKSLGVINLTQAISVARKDFRTLPSAISTQTERVRADILRDIENRRQIVHNSARILNDIVRHLTSGLHSLARHLDIGLDRLNKYELWRWVIMLTCNIAFGFVMLLILLAIFCGCGNAKIHAKRTLQVSSFCICFVSIILWSMVSAVFLISGHAEVFACQILWDSPQYNTLSSLLNRPSPLLTDNMGIFDALFQDLDNVTIEVSVKDVLRECEKNEPAYVVFQLEKILDVNKETSYFEWDELQDDLKRLSASIDVGFLKTISDNFNKLLNRILVISDVNLTKYRMEYNGPVVGKDLPSFVDQLENVAIQVTDLNTAGRLETLATRTQRLHLSNIKPLEHLRTELVFKLTELELQMMPFRRKLNISLSHIHTAQFYIDNQGDVIAQKKLSTFITRLLSHTAGWRTHVLDAAGQHAGRCRPLYDVFAAVRSLVCTRYVSSLHGWWFCGFLLGFIWCAVLTPLCVKLWRTYNKKLRALDTLTLTHLGQEPGTPATAPCDDSGWNTPGPPPPPRNDSW